MKRYKAFIVICVGVVLALSVMVIGAARPNAYTTEEAIACAFEAMDLKDAKFVGEEAISELYEEMCLLYTSEEEQMAFYFNPQTGSLTLAKKLNADFEAASSPYAELSAQEHTDYVMEYVQKAVAADLIGVLTVTEAPTEDDYSKNYVFTEYYDEIPTGTQVFVSCLFNGEINYIMPLLGNLFQPASFGRYELRNGNELIGEASACEIADKRIEEVGEGYAPTAAEPVVELRAKGEELFYEVTVETVNSFEWNRSYVIKVDAYSGAVLETAFTK